MWREMPDFVSIRGLREAWHGFRWGGIEMEG